MLRTSLKIVSVLLAAVLIGCEGTLELRESKQAPQWDEVLHATAPLLPDEVGTGFQGEHPPPKLYIDPGIAPAPGTGWQVVPASEAVTRQREQIARRAGFSIRSFNFDVYCGHDWRGRLELDRYPASCENGLAQGVTVAYSEPVYEKGRWLVWAEVVNGGGMSGYVDFELARSGGDWAVTEMKSNIVPFY